MLFALSVPGRPLLRDREEVVEVLSDPERALLV